MAEPFLAEIKLVGFTFAPRGFAACDGQILPINQNQSLYSLLGTTYGGDGRTTFALPDLRGRVPVHVAYGYAQGQRSGEETHTLQAGELPSHSHSLQASSNPGSTPMAPNTVLGSFAGGYGTGGGLVSPTSITIGNAQNNGGGTATGGAHENMQPYLTILFCIALQGLFPSRN